MRKGVYYSLSDYEISTDGVIKNAHNGHIVKPQINGKGYQRVSIGGKLQFVHRLVAEKYIPNPDNKPQINHKDGNKLNNHVDNLEWVINQENREHAVHNALHLSGEKCPWAKLSLEDVKYIRSHHNIKYSELAEKFNVSVSAINGIVNNYNWKE